MSVKYINFFCYCFFTSTIICLMLEGSWWGTVHNSNTILNQLSVIQAIKAGGIFSVASATINFFSGLMRLILWDYSFYTGGWEVMRAFWIFLFAPGTVWGVYQGLAYIFAQLIPRIGI